MRDIQFPLTTAQVCERPEVDVVESTARAWARANDVQMFAGSYAWSEDDVRALVDDLDAADEEDNEGDED